MLNSHDLFQQIGFIVDSNDKSSPSKSYKRSKYSSKNSLYAQANKYSQNPIYLQQQFKVPEYITSLQIQLSQDQSHILQIKSYDDPYQLAQKFCNRHNLNRLAVQIVQKKIIQAKQKQQMKLKTSKRISQKQSNRNSIINQINIQSKSISKEVSNKNSIRQSPFKNKSFNEEANNSNLMDRFKPKQPLNNKYYRQSQIQQSRSNNKSITPLKEKNISQKYIQHKNNISVQESKNLSRSKTKNKTKNSKLSQQQKQNKHMRTKSAIQAACQNLYIRGMQQSKKIQEKRIKRQQQKQKKEQQQLTFKPKINNVSQKIIQFRRQTGTVKPKNTNKSKNKLAEKLYQQLKQCTFTPEINKISKIIVHNRQAYRTQNQHFTQVWNNNSSNFDFDNIQNQMQAQNYQIRKGNNSQNKLNLLNYTNNRKSKQFLQTMKQLQEQNLFKPKLNPKSLEQVTEPFYVRLEKAIHNKQKIKQGQFMNNQYSFKPKIGRSPYFNSREQKGKQNLPVWEQLYKESQQRAQRIKKEQEKRKKMQKNHPSASTLYSELGHSQTSKGSFTGTSKGSSNLYYQNLIQKRVTFIFQQLDSDFDKLISPQKISIQNLSKNVLIFLKPIFQEMDQLNAELNFNEFKKAVINLLNDSDPYKKGLFLSQNSKIKDTDCTFIPNINQKSRQLASCKTSHQNIHQELYQQGVKNLQKKQFMLQKQRAKKQQQKLLECSFKPCLKLGSKNYQPHVFNKKIEQIQLDEFNKKNQQKQEHYKSYQFNIQNLGSFQQSHSYENQNY